MVILFFSRLFYPHIGGVDKHTLRVSQELIKLGHKVTVITEGYKPKLKLFENYSGIRIYRIPVWDVSEKFKKWLIWHWLFNHLHLIHHATIVHIHDVFFWYLPFRFLFPSKKVFITFHGYETTFPPSKTAIWQRRLATKLTHGSIAVGDYIDKWYKTRSDLVIYGGTDSKPMPLPKKSSILVLGRLSQDNNMGIVLQALRQTKLPVTFVGDGPYRQQAEKIGQVTGFIANITSYLRRASLVIASSYLSIIDALAAGRPVISVYQNPLKKDYLQTSPLSKYISLANSPKILQKLFINPPRKPHWENPPTWDKIATTYLNLWNYGE